MNHDNFVAMSRLPRYQLVRDMAIHSVFLVLVVLVKACWLHLEVNPLSSLRHEKVTAKLGKLTHAAAEGLARRPIPRHTNRRTATVSVWQFLVSRQWCI